MLGSMSWRDAWAENALAFFSDQLSKYGDIDSLKSHWLETIKQIRSKAFPGDNEDGLYKIGPLIRLLIREKLMHFEHLRAPAVFKARKPKSQSWDSHCNIVPQLHNITPRWLKIWKHTSLVNKRGSMHFASWKLFFQLVTDSDNVEKKLKFYNKDELEMMLDRDGVIDVKELWPPELRESERIREIWVKNATVPELRRMLHRVRPKMIESISIDKSNAELKSEVVRLRKREQELEEELSRLKKRMRKNK